MAAFKDVMHNLTIAFLPSATTLKYLSSSPAGSVWPGKGLVNTSTPASWERHLKQAVVTFTNLSQFGKTEKRELPYTGPVVIGNSAALSVVF